MNPQKFSQTNPQTLYVSTFGDSGDPMSKWFTSLETSLAQLSKNINFLARQTHQRQSIPNPELTHHSPSNKSRPQKKTAH
jgi:hypothetical protein